MNILRTIGLMAVALSVSAAAQGTYDIVIYGGTSAAVSAAVQARRMGKTVVIVCPERHLGGMTTGGLGWTDSGRKEVIGGIAREFYHRLYLHYEKPENWKWQKREEYGNKGQGTPAIDGTQRTMWIFEPHAAERVIEDMIAEFKIPVHRNEWLDRKNGVVKRNARIASITTLSGKRFNGRMFIDATYEGDLLAAAGVKYHVGRESNSVYGEKRNGVQKDLRDHKHHFEAKISAYRVPGDPKSGLLPNAA